MTWKCVLRFQCMLHRFKQKPHQIPSLNVKQFYNCGLIKIRCVLDMLRMQSFESKYEWNGCGYEFVWNSKWISSSCGMISKCSWNANSLWYKIPQIEFDKANHSFCQRLNKFSVNTYFTHADMPIMHETFVYAYCIQTYYILHHVHVSI